MLNRMYYVRGNKKNYDDWEKRGNIGWSYKDVLPYFLKSEDNLQIDSLDRNYHSTGGYLPVTQRPYHYPIEKDIMNGVRELGLKVGDFNGERQTSFMYAQTTSKNGIRFSASRAFLRPVQNRPNLHILLNTTVTRVLIHPLTKQSYGVELITTQGYERNISATKEVIVSGGSISSPQILLLSGIGPREELEQVGVPVVHHLVGVGRNLRDHFAYNVKFFVNETTDNNLNWATALQYLLFRSGPVSTCGSDVIGFIKTKYANVSEDFPDIELVFTGYSAGCSRTGVIGESNDDFINGVAPKGNVGFKPSLFRPKSKGYLTLRDKHPQSHPKIFPHYLTHPQDIARLVEAVKFSLNLSQTDSLRKYGLELDRTPVEGCGDKLFGSDEYWECAIRKDAYPDYHQVGTCKMGPDSDPEAVVDPQLKVWGLRGLRVVDSSIIPEILTGNTMAPAMMIGEKASDMIKQQWSETACCRID